MATGPSLTAEQVEAVRRSGVRSIAINDLGLPQRSPNAAWADIWYAADWKFWEFYQQEALDSACLRVSAKALDVQLGRAHLHLNTKDGGKGDAHATSGGHSGFQALQIAMFLGASTILLIGYDCKPKGDKTNYFGRKPRELHKGSHYESWPKCYEKLKVSEGVEIVNATPGSAIKAFPFRDISQCL